MKGFKSLVWVSACLIAAGFGVFAPSADSAVLPASAGRQYPTSSEGCWESFYSAEINNCGSGTTNVQKWLVPVSVPLWGTYNVRAKAYGQFLQTAAWASCVAVSSDGSFITVSGRGTTNTSTASVQDLDLGTIFTGYFFPGASYTTTYFDCDVTYGGRVEAVAHWQ
jgi:hypothetical protein